MASTFLASPDCGVCSGCGDPDSPLVVCVAGCNGQRIAGARVVATDSGGAVVLDAPTGDRGCAPELFLGPGTYHVAIAPPAGSGGWDLTERDFTIPGGLALPIPLKLAAGYTCGCRTPDRHDYLGPGNPRPNLPTTLYFSSTIGACTLTWFPRTLSSRFPVGVYYGSFTVSGFPASDSTRDPYGNPQCLDMRHASALVEVFFNPCSAYLGIPAGGCFSTGSPTDTFDYGGLCFGVRYICSCIKCNVDVGGMRIFDRIPDPNTVPLADPHSLAEFSLSQTSSIAGATMGFASALYKDGLAVGYDPFLWTANHYAGTFGRGLGDCVRETWLPAGTAVVSE